MRVLVTGGAGFIGRHLVGALVERGDHVIVLDNLRRGDPKALPRDACFIEGDIRDETAVARAVAGCELVYHLAAQSNVMGAMSDVDYSFTSNVAGTFNVLKAAANAGARRLVFSSSREVYGEPERLPVSEDTPLLAKNPYGASKVAGEAYCRTWHHATPLDAYVLRFANVYGPGDSGRVIPLWTAAALAGEPLRLFGGGQVLDFVHVDIAVEALLRAGDAENRGPVNVGTGVGTGLPALAERILELTGRRSELVVEPPRGPEVVRFVADVRRMQAVLGIARPGDPLAGLPALVAQRANRDMPLDRSQRSGPIGGL
ncbi:MAG: NAD-dependent epimerase/dehydratase family protein [Hyphomicrobiales bacterium]